MHYLVTGAAGFIGYHVAQKLIAGGHTVTGLDNLNAYYDPQLKKDRLARLTLLDGFSFEQIDLADRPTMKALFERGQFDRVVHLAAQAGVRHSLTHPEDYVDSNLSGFLTILEGCRHNGVKHLVFASSSSVYGSNREMPFSTSHNTDHPQSLYAATKKANELMAHSYSHIYGLPVTGLRFFTVYGPWGRPDMALFMFTRNILAGKPIDVFNNGHHSRDFTYIDDIVEGVVRVADHVPQPSVPLISGNGDPSRSHAPYQVFNIGNNSPVALLDFIGAIEKALGRTAQKNFLPMHPGDVEATCADVQALEQAVEFRPSTRLEDGIAQFVAWYRTYYKA